MYNQYTPYNPYGYQQYMQQFSGYQQNQQTVNPNNMEIIPVPTIQQVEQVGLQPGQRKMIMVQNEPVIAARYADNMGLVTTEYYHLEKFTPGAPAPTQMDNYITRQEFNAFVESLNKPTQKTKKEAASE